MKATLFETPPPKDKVGWGVGGLHEAGAKETASSGFHNHLELRLGISSSNEGSDAAVPTSSSSEGKSHGGSGPSFSTTRPDHGLHLGWVGNTWLPQAGHAGFIHPWSLAARQQKAVLEQAHHKSKPSPSSYYNTPMPSVPGQLFFPSVGWPPIHTFRRNLVDPQLLKFEMDGTKDAKRVKSMEKEIIIKTSEEQPTMFVKVNMEGYFVGRKIDLKAHDSYESLFHAIKKMFYNFLSINCMDNSNEQEKDEAASSDFILIYEDHEGDRMLVGDVPWELFLGSVKRLYIANNPNALHKS